MSNADERLDSHETRISNLEAERGVVVRDVQDLRRNQTSLANEVHEHGQTLARVKSIAEAAKRDVDSLGHRMQTFETAIARAVDKMTAGTQEHLKRQDDVLERQNAVLVRLDAGLSRLVKKADDEDTIIGADKRRAERVVWWAKAIAAVAVAAGLIVAAVRFLLLTKG